MPSKLRCTICCEAYTNSDDIHTTVCGHVYHFVCIQLWKARLTSCPECCAHNPATHKIYLNFEPDNGDDEIYKKSNCKIVSLQFLVMEEYNEKNKQKMKDLMAKNRNLSTSEVELLQMPSQYKKKDNQIKDLMEKNRYLTLQNEGRIAKLNRKSKVIDELQQQLEENILELTSNFRMNPNLTVIERRDKQQQYPSPRKNVENWRLSPTDACKEHQDHQQQQQQHQHSVLQPSNNFMRNMENNRTFNLPPPPLTSPPPSDQNYIPVQASIGGKYVSIMVPRDSIMPMVANEYGGGQYNGGHGAPPPLQPGNYRPPTTNYNTFGYNSDAGSRPSSRNCQNMPSNGFPHNGSDCSYMPNNNNYQHKRDNNSSSGSGGHHNLFAKAKTLRQYGYNFVYVHNHQVFARIDKTYKPVLIKNFGQVDEMIDARKSFERMH